jgi:vacuolar-type H+-ATPase subunit B/Vma2
VHAEAQCRLHGLCLLPDAREEIITDTLTDATGIMGWWMFSLAACCPVDVMPLGAAVSSMSHPRDERWDEATTRLNHVKIAVELLRVYADGGMLKDIESFLKIIRTALT